MPPMTKPENTPTFHEHTGVRTRLSSQTGSWTPAVDSDRGRHAASPYGADVTSTRSATARRSRARTPRRPDAPGGARHPARHRSSSCSASQPVRRRSPSRSKAQSNRCQEYECARHVHGRTGRAPAWMKRQQETRSRPRWLSRAKQIRETECPLGPIGQWLVRRPPSCVPRAVSALSRYHAYADSMP